MSVDQTQVIAEYASRYDGVLKFSAGEDSEGFIRFLTSELSDDELDDIDVHRLLDRKDDLASEPITAAVLIGLGSVVVRAVGRIVERWLEKERQREQVELVIEAYKVSPEVAKVVSDIVTAHARVSVAYPLNSAD